MKDFLPPQVMNIEPRALFMLNTSPPSQVLFLWHQIDEAKVQCLAPKSTFDTIPGCASLVYLQEDLLQVS